MAKQTKPPANPGKLVRNITALNLCTGYDPAFIDGRKTISPNLLSATHKAQLPKVNNGPKGPLHYTNISVYLNTQRRMAFYSAYNIDGAKPKKVTRDLGFITDPRINPDEQLAEGFYDLIKNKKDFDKGHMAANHEMAWDPLAQTKAYQTFFYANACPQVSILNKGIWKGLETYFINEAQTIDNKRICVFTGPILKAGDPGFIKDPTVKLPIHFYKVVVFKQGTQFHSTAFIMSQLQGLHDLKLLAPEPEMKIMEIAQPQKGPFDDFPYADIFQVDVSLVSSETGINFSWPGVKAHPVTDSKKRIKTIDEVQSAKDAKAKQKTLKTEALSLERKAVIDDTFGFEYPS